ncbi:MAG: SDR family oxidoreductase [Deltaproteobacteria bacterium]|nr:SDR family oxidoreductase [Deltaproteobacteria bacterium]MBW2445783.1 SDR family oxidoreductase [Deltaproteobacteria bacterium]
MGFFQDWFRDRLAGRPGWMNALMLFSVFMAVIYCPWDILVKPAAIDEEVWFGIRFHGAWAKILAIPHWVLYAGMAHGFWRMRSWMHPWAAVYWAQVAIGMLIWPLLYVDGFGGVLVGVVSFLAFGALTRALWQAKPLFEASHAPLRERYGEWAVVTGASAGIGVEFARALAKEGVSCVLAARREDRMTALAEELEQEHGVKTRVVAVDLSDEAGASELADAVADLPISILVNNAGYGLAGRFSELDAERMRRMVVLNCAAPVVLTHRLLPGMLERGAGAVLVTGSIAGSQPLPLHAVYGATKAFDAHFTESLWGELQGTGVDVLVLEPGSTESEFHDTAGELPHEGQPAHEVVAAAFDALGQQPAVVAGWFNWLRAAGARRLLPRSTQALVARQVVESQTREGLR